MLLIYAVYPNSKKALWRLHRIGTSVELPTCFRNTLLNSCDSHASYRLGNLPPMISLTGHSSPCVCVSCKPFNASRCERLVYQPCQQGWGGMVANNLNSTSPPTQWVAQQSFTSNSKAHLRNSGNPCQVQTCRPRHGSPWGVMIASGSSTAQLVIMQPTRMYALVDVWVQAW